MYLDDNTPRSASVTDSRLDDSMPASSVRIVDCTLRDGEQQPGVSFIADEKVAIAKELDALGIDEIEAGTPASGEEDAEAIAAIVALGLKARVSALARALVEDVDLVASTGAWGVRISLPLSSIQRAAKLKLSDEDYVDRAIEICSAAKERGLVVILSPYDTTRSDPELLRRVVTRLNTAGCVDRLRIVDTSGCSTPAHTKRYVRIMKDATDIPIEAHFHNDFGLATANTLAAAEAGAEYLSVTVNGIGERGGNASLEEVAAAMEFLYGVETGLDLTRLTELSRLVEVLSGVPLQPHKAIVGKNSFAHESGMVVGGLMKDRAVAEPYPPALVGQRTRIELGKLSGLASIKLVAAGLGIDVSTDQARALLVLVKQQATLHKRSVSLDEFARLSSVVLARSTN